MVVFVLESPSTVLGLLKKPLQEQNITYGEMQGGLLSGFSLKDVNYNNQVLAKELALQVDFEALKNRLLVIDNFVLREAHIEKEFLTSLIENNSSDENKSESNITLPFDTILIKNADISVKNTGYKNYHVNHAKLHLSNLKTDMKTEHSGAFTFLLDSNMSQADINASFKNESYDVLAKVEGNRDFIAPFVKEYNLTLLVNPKLTLKAKGDLEAVKYEVNIHELSLKQNDYLVKSKVFRTKGTFNMEEHSVVNALTTELDGNVAYLKLDALTSLDLDDLNNTLVFDIDGKVNPKKTFIPANLAEQNITIQALPKIRLLAKGDMNDVTFTTIIKGLKAKQNHLSLNLKKLELKGSAKPLKGDLKSNLITHFNSSVADGMIKVKSSLNYKDLNNTLKFDVNSKLTTHGNYLSKLLKDVNVTVFGKSKIALSAKGSMKKVEFKTDVNNFRAKQNDIKLHVNNLSVEGETQPIKGDTKVKLVTRFKSTVADGNIKAKTELNFNDVNNSLHFDVKSKLTAHGNYLSKLLKDTNVTVFGKSKIALSAKGSMKKVEFKTDVNNFRAKQNDIKLHVNNLSVEGETQPIKGDTKVKLVTRFKSTVADGNIKAKTELNFNDVNNSLYFDVNSKLTAHGNYLSKLLKDTNVTVFGKSKIALNAKGSMNKIEFKTDVNNFRAKQNDIKLHVNNLSVEGETQPINGDTEVKLVTNFKSTVADGALNTETKLNLKDVNNSLRFTTKLDFMVHDRYVNNFLKDANVTLKGDSHVDLIASGNIKEVEIKLDAKAKLFAQKVLSSLTLKTSAIRVNIEENLVKGSLKLNSTAKNIALKIDSNFDGDYTKPKKMMTQTNVSIGNFNAFGVNLTSLTPLNLELKNGQSGAFVKLNSKKIQLDIKSSNLDYLTFDLKTEKIYPSQIVKVPEELQDKFVIVDLKGEATISKKYVSLKGFIASNKKFKAILDVKNSKKGLVLDLYTKHLKINAKGNIEKKSVKATVDIDSLTKVQEEFVLLYPFKITPINGSLHLKTELQGEDVLATISSPKLKFDGFNIEKINIDGHYSKSLLTLNKLNFQTTGFKDRKLNKKFYLNQKGFIHLGEKRDVFLDMSPKILVNMKGTTENLKGDFTIESLPLGHPDYGFMDLSTSIHYEQIGKKKKIIGGISLEKMKLFYEAKFLDPANDADVIVLTKKDKNKKKKERDSFLEDTFIDLAIYAPDAEYKTRDIELDFTVDVHAKKDFGKSLGMLGKIREINGRVEQAPKLFTVVDSTIVFRGTKEINPLLDIEVQHELPDVLITIFIHGDAKHPKLDFSSDPQMPKKDILSYLLLGVSTTTLSEGESNLGREAQLFIMNQAARDLAYEVDLDRVFIKDDGTGEGYAVQVGKKINDNTMLVIENSKEGNSFILEYEVNKNIKIEVGQHQKTVPSQSIDIFFRKKFK